MKQNCNNCLRDMVHRDFIGIYTGNKVKVLQIYGAEHFFSEIILSYPYSGREIKKPTCVENPAFNPNDDDSLASPSFIETHCSKNVFVPKSTSTFTAKKDRRQYRCSPTCKTVSTCELALFILTLVALVIGISLAIRYTVFYEGRKTTSDSFDEHDIRDKAPVKCVKTQAMIPPPPIPPLPLRLQRHEEEEAP